MKQKLCVISTKIFVYFEVYDITLRSENNFIYMASAALLDISKSINKILLDSSAQISLNLTNNASNVCFQFFNRSWFVAIDL